MQEILETVTKRDCERNMGLKMPRLKIKETSTDDCNGCRWCRWIEEYKRYMCIHAWCEDKSEYVECQGKYRDGELI